MEVCQRCNAKIEDDDVGQVRFGVWDVVSREWLLCPECTQTMRDMVFGFMGEGEKDDLPKITEELKDGLYSCRECGAVLFKVIDSDGSENTEPPDEMSASEMSDACARYLAEGFLQQFRKATDEPEAKTVKDMTTDELVAYLKESGYTTFGDSPLCEDEAFVALKERAEASDIYLEALQESIEGLAGCSRVVCGKDSQQEA